MKILVVGNLIKDVYLDLDPRTERFETDDKGVKWLDLSFNTSEHRFFNRNSSFGGAAITFEVLNKLGVPAVVDGVKLRLEEDGLVADSLADTYRYILTASAGKHDLADSDDVDSAVSYFVPTVPAPTSFSSPSEPYDLVFIDRSARLTRTAVKKITAFLDISSHTKLAIYLKNPIDPGLKDLIDRAKIIFFEETKQNETPTHLIPVDKMVHLSENAISAAGQTRSFSLSHVNTRTHLSVYSIAAATFLGAFLLGKPIKDILDLTVANLEHSRLNSVLTLSELEQVLAGTEPTPSKKGELELIAANLLYHGKGILAADESGGSIKKKFAQLNIPDTFQNRRDYRNIFFTTQHLSDFVNGVILFDETTRQLADNGQNFVDFLISQRIIPGIKVDQGLAKIENSDETYTQGLEGLPERLAEYYNRGLRFAKWRAAFEIHLSDNDLILTPTPYAIEKNCQILAQYAKDCQNAGLVPIVEPEVVYDGYYSQAQNATVTGQILDRLFAELKKAEVNLKGCILKVNMVLAGKHYGVASTPVEVGIRTAEVLKSHVPEDLAGVVFLSGGQTVTQATDNLAEIIKNGPFPWPLTFSFARALQDPALYAWKGNNQNANAARTAFLDRLKANCEALTAVDF